jgi:hypothetical protein
MPLGHGRGRERQAVPLDHAAQQVRIGHAHGGRTDHRDRPAGRCDQFTGAGDRPVRGPGEARGYGRGRHRFPRGRQRHVFRQVEMHRPLGLGERQRDRRIHDFGDAPLLQPEGRLGDRCEQGMVVDPHLDAAADLAGVEIAGDRDHRRAVEIGAADAGREIGGAGPKRRDAQARPASHAPGHVGGKPGRALMGREHEVDPALAHRLHQRQHIAARNAEAAVDARRLQDGDDQVGIVHGFHVPDWLGHMALDIAFRANGLGFIRS